MKVIICKDELTAKDGSDNVYKINGVQIRKDPPKDPAFYDMTTSFAKACCAAGTEHQAVLVGAGLINIM